MPRTLSSKKALRQSLKRRKLNLTIKENLKKLIKTAKFQKLSQIISAIDKASKKGIIDKNKAARLKSRLVRKFAKKTQKKIKKVN